MPTTYHQAFCQWSGPQRKPSLVLFTLGHRGIHPGANVALDLILWLGIIPSIAFALFFGIIDRKEGLAVVFLGGIFW
jgi:hypothetical protein